MRRHAVSLVCCVLAVFFFASSGFAFAAAPKAGGKAWPRPVPLKSEEPAHGFNLATVEGGRAALEDYAGKKIILFFFTTWCPYCVAKFPVLEKEKAKFEEQGIVLLVINVGESQAKVASFREKRNIGFNILLDESMSTAQNYQVIGVPTFFLVGTNGVVIYDGNDLPWNYPEIFSKEKLYSKE